MRTSGCTSADNAVFVPARTGTASTYTTQPRFGLAHVLAKKNNPVSAHRRAGDDCGLCSGAEAQESPYPEFFSYYEAPEQLFETGSGGLFALPPPFCQIAPFCCKAPPPSSGQNHEMASDSAFMRLFGASRWPSEFSFAC